MPRIKNILCHPAALILVVFIFCCSSAGGAVRILKADDIKPRIRLCNGPIINGSDSLVADGMPLSRDADYNIDYIDGTLFLLSLPLDYQRLEIHFTPLPSWLKKYYGIRPGLTESPLPTQGISTDIGPPPKSIGPSSMSIRGAKTFSVSSQSGGTSQFNQALELTVGGEIAPGLEVSGSVADRGYDPAYGAINSQISELDKLNLRISSKQFYSEVGSLELNQYSPYGGPQLKQVSGLRAAYTGNRYTVSTLFGRPRGKFETAKFRGQDQIQGPYRITADNVIESIVPGSEKVWVDGRLLERGADRDYVMDYPAATVTFMPRILIDSRSRIEIDFEPLTSDYEREIFEASGGAATEDSLLFFRIGFVREGDDRDRLKSGELSNADLNILQNIGDSVSFNFRDGAVLDSNGAYVERFDTSGYRYFEYIGDSLGDYRVSFSPVGTGKGAYLFEGNDVYSYVGENLGDYLPVITIPVPGREDYFESELGFRPGGDSRFGITMRRSEYDRNLHSTLDDGDNSGGQYILRAGAGGIPSRYARKSGLDLTADIIENNFKSRNRRNRPDEDRKYLIPDKLIPSGDERKYDIASSLIVPGPYNIYVNSGLLDYADQFNSYYGQFEIIPDSTGSLLPALSYSRLRAEYDSSDAELDGEYEIFGGRVNYDISKKAGFIASYSHDRRWNEYYDEMRGTTEQKYDAVIQYGPAEMKLERYEEDTLLTDWSEYLTRNQAVLSVSGRIGPVNSDLYITGRRTTRNDLAEEQFMARVKMSYAPVRSNFNIGGSYALSDENRFERGVRYIEVEPGEGQFLFIDGQYVPDPDGNYIEIEEIHSNQAEVNKGEKTFQLNYTPPDVYLKLSANSTEELLSGGDRNLLWLLPFYSDGDQPYLLRRLFYQSDIKLLSYSGYYFANMTASYNYESRRIGGADYEKYDIVAKLSLNEASGMWRFLQDGSYFKYVRDSYYSSPGDIDGFKVQLNVIRKLIAGQVNLSTAYRFAEDIDGSNSRQYTATVNPRIRLIAGGETSIKIDGYLQELDAPGFVSYRLVDNKYGERGINWSVRSDYRIKKDLRINISFSGRHSDDRTPRITGRGEIIASF